MEIAGKTGTAQNGINNTGLDDAVFTCFAPASNPQIAVGVIVKGGGFGADAAAPDRGEGHPGVPQGKGDAPVTARHPLADRPAAGSTQDRAGGAAPVQTTTQDGNCTVRDMTQPRLLGGRYELDGVVGRGGMAEVYRARDLRLDRIVAVKTLREDLARDQTFQARFRREAQSAASLNHPSIVAVYDTGEDMAGHAPGALHRDGVRRRPDPARPAARRPAAAARAGAWRSPTGCCGRWTTATATGSCTATSSPAT